MRATRGGRQARAVTLFFASNVALRFVAIIAAVLAGFATVAVADDAPPERLAAVLATCTGCHGENGVSATPGIPSLAGQNAHYLLEKLVDLRRGARPAVVMQPIAAALAEDDLPLLARHFAGLPYLRPPQTVDPAKAAAGGEAYERVCYVCHPNRGKATPYAEYPLLAGQDLTYMQRTMADILSGARKANGMMVEMIGLVPPDKLDAAMHFFAAQEIQPGEVKGTQLGAAGIRQRRFRPQPAN